MFEIQLLLPDLLEYAGNVVPITAETNEERLEQLLSWIESLDECAHPAGEAPRISFLEAKQLAASIRVMMSQSL